MMIILSAAMAGAAILCWLGAVRSKLGAAAATLAVLLSFLLLGFYAVSEHLTGDGINDAVLYHLNVDLLTAGIWDFRGLVMSTLAYVAFVTVVCFLIFRHVQASVDSAENPVRLLFGLFSICASLALNPALADLRDLYQFHQLSGDTEFPAEYIPVAALERKAGVKGPVNIVHLYLESLERTYFDEQRFPGLLPNLKKLEREALSFSEVQQVDGTAYTVAGIAAMQCGVPLFIGGNSMSGVDQFLPGATCIGDLLSAEDYTLSFLGGASLDFAGKGAFFRTHGFDRVLGREALLHAIEDKDYVSNWGLYDDTLFELAKNEFEALSAAGRPFGLFLLTLNTHHPRGHMPRYCQGMRYGDGSDPMLNALHCADLLAADFIRHVRDSDGFENTLLVVSSDHLAMRNTIYATLKRGRRRNLLMAFRSDTQPSRVKTSGSALDVAPTVLNLMGYQLSGLGFGRDLLEPDVSIFEDHRQFNGLLARNRAVVQSLWRFPQLTAGIELEVSTGQLRLQDRHVRYPALFLLDANLAVQEIRFGFYNPKSLDQQVAELAADQRLLWVDDCRVNAWFADVSALEQHGLCAVFGAPGNRSNRIQRLADGATIAFTELERTFHRLSIDAELARARSNNSPRLLQYTGSREGSGSDHDLTGNYTVQSSGGRQTGPSYIEDLSSGSRLRLDRGVSLVGFSADGAPALLRNVDCCSKEESEPAEETADLASIIDDVESYFGAFAVVVHDSARLKSDDLPVRFPAMRLRTWEGLGFREPYIAVFSGNGEFEEFTAGPGERVTLELRDFIAHRSSPGQRRLRHLPMVAHAGGGYQGETYTNSFDALEANYGKFELFELDFSWTLDGHLVCLHDWDKSYERAFGLKPRGKTTLDEFARTVRKHTELSKCTLDTLAAWLREHPNARIVTDIREDNLEALRYIATQYHGLQHRFVPQVYQPAEYFRARDLGYNDVIWTLYRFRGSDDEVLAQLGSMDLLGLTMPRRRADRQLAARAREETGVLSWVHTINAPAEVEKYRQLGGASVYTDWLQD